MTVCMVEGKQSTYPNPAFMLAKVTECKNLNVSYKSRLNQTWSITVAVTDSPTNRWIDMQMILAAIFDRFTSNWFWQEDF